MNNDGGCVLASNTKELLLQIRNYFSDFKVTEYDLKTPTTNFVTEFYKMFLDEFFIEPNTITQMTANQMTALAEYSDMYMELIPLINLTVTIQKFCIPALKTFCIYDLIHPAPKRTFNHLASVMQFIVFADMRVGSLEPKLEKIPDMEIRKQNLLKNIDEMKQSYNARLMEIANMKSAVKEKDEEIVRLKAEMDEMTHLNEDLCEKRNAVKLDLEKLKSKYEDDLAQVQMLENDIKELNNKIKLLKSNDTTLDVSCVTLSNEILKEKASESEEKLNEIRTNLTACQEHCENLEKCYAAHVSSLKLLKEITRYIDEKDKNKRRHSDLEKEIKTLAENMEKLKTCILAKDNELKKKKTELVGLNLQWTKQKSSMMESLDATKKEYELQKEVNIKNNNELREINAKEQACYKNMEENESIYNNLLDAYEKRYEAENIKEVKAAEKILQSLNKLDNKLNKF